MFFLIFQTIAFLAISGALIGVAFVFSPYKPYVWCEKHKEEVKENEESLLDQDGEARVEYEGADGPHDVEYLAVAENARQGVNVEKSPLRPNSLARTSEEEEKPPILESLDTGVLKTDEVLEQVDLNLGGISVTPGKTNQSHDETTEDGERKSGMGKIVKNTEGQHVLVCPDGQRLLLDKLGVDFSDNDSAGSFMRKGKEMLSASGEKGKAIAKLAEGKIDDIKEKIKNSGWQEKLKNLTKGFSDSKNASGDKVPEKVSVAGPRDGNSQKIDLLTNMASKIKLGGGDNFTKCTKDGPKRKMPGYMKAVLKEAMKHALAETYYDTFMFEKVKAICDTMNAAREEVEEKLI